MADVTLTFWEFLGVMVGCYALGVFTCWLNKVQDTDKDSEVIP